MVNLAALAATSVARPFLSAQSAEPGGPSSAVRAGQGLMPGRSLSSAALQPLACLPGQDVIAKKVDNGYTTYACGTCGDKGSALADQSLTCKPGFYPGAVDRIDADYQDSYDYQTFHCQRPATAPDADNSDQVDAGDLSCFTTTQAPETTEPETTTVASEGDKGGSPTGAGFIGAGVGGAVFGAAGLALGAAAGVGGTLGVQALRRS